MLSLQTSTIRLPVCLQMRLMSWNTRATPVQLEVGPPRPHSRGRCHTKRRNASVRPQGAPRCPAFRPARKTRCRAGHEAGSSGGGKGDEIPDSIPSWNSSSDWRDFRSVGCHQHDGHASAASNLCGCHVSHITTLPVFILRFPLLWPPQSSSRHELREETL